jgi:hypothetical protein
VMIANTAMICTMRAVEGRLRSANWTYEICVRLAAL